MYGWSDQGTGGGWLVMMMLGMLLFAAILAFGLVALWRNSRSGSESTTTPSGASAIAILQERFARGELTEEEYLRRLAMLKGQS